MTSAQASRDCTHAHNASTRKPLGILAFLQVYKYSCELYFTWNGDPQYLCIHCNYSTAMLWILTLNY